MTHELGWTYWSHDEIRHNSFGILDREGNPSEKLRYLAIVYPQRIAGRDPDIRYGDKFPYWPLDATRVEIYGTEQLMYLGRHGNGWQAVVAGGEVVAGQSGRWCDPQAIEDFVDCIRTRREPKANILQGHLSASLEHLANIAYRTGNQKLVFDGKTEKFVGNDEANQYLKAAGRGRYRISEEV